MPGQAHTDSQLIDISPVLTTKIAVWPGDTPFSRETLLELKSGANIDLSTLHSTVHVGAHADAPSHYKMGALSIGDVDLAAYIGPCHVVELTTRPSDGLIALAHWDHSSWARAQSRAPRVLFKTLSFPDPNTFSEDFFAFAPETIRYLGEHGALLVGIDTPSVDAFSSKELPSHHELARWNMRNLEGLILDHVAAGVYELIALPLKLASFDGSPVRAVLRKAMAGS